jgi:hypothetical protein
MQLKYVRVENISLLYCNAHCTMAKLTRALGIQRKGRQPVPRTIQQTFARRQTITRLRHSLDLVEECHL